MFPILRAMDKVHPRPLAWGGPWGGPAGNWREGEGRRREEEEEEEEKGRQPGRREPEVPAGIVLNG